MKKLLASTAVALIALSGTASAQSVLERVLGQIDNSTNLASVNGTFANIAENIGGAGSVTVYTNNAGVVLTEAEYAALAAQPSRADYTAIPTGSFVNTATGQIISSDAHAALSATDRAAYVSTGAVSSVYAIDANGKVITAAAVSLLPETSPATGYQPTVVAVAGLAGVNGSINNIVDGITAATQTALAGTGVSAIEWDMPTLDFGDMATTALGAVNTGEITLGVNASVDEAKTTSTQAVSTVMGQIGGSANTGALVLNIASNMTGINGSINNSMTEVNGTVGDLSTTALGAVNTGTIISGVNSAVQGIVGVSGANVASN